MKKLIATLLAFFAVCFPLFSRADTMNDFVIFSGSDQITYEIQDDLDGSLSLTILLKNSDPSILVDTSLPLPDDAAAHILNDPHLSAVIDNNTNQTLTETGSLKGRFVIALLDFRKIKDEIEIVFFAGEYLITQENAAYAALGLSPSDSGVLDEYALSQYPDTLAIPIQEGDKAKLIVYTGDDLNAGITPDTDKLTIEIDASGLTFAPLPTHVAGFDRVSAGGASRVAPTLSYTARTAFGARESKVPGNISWSFSDSFSTIYDTAPNGGSLANLSDYLIASYSPGASVSLGWTASPLDTRFSPASGAVSADIVQGAPQALGAMGADFGAPSINTSHSTYNGYGDFLIQTGSMRRQLSGLSINGVALLEDVDYIVEETAGNTAVIRVYESAMQAVSQGDAQITVNFVNGSVNTTVMIAGYYMPEILTDPPKTGDEQAMGGFSLLLLSIILALTTAQIAKRAKS